MNVDNSLIYASSYTGDDSIPAFVAFAIEQYKIHKGLSGESAMKILSHYGILDYLVDNFEVLHTQGAGWLMDEIDELIEKNGDNRQ